MTLIIPNRRGFIGGLVGLIAAPAIIKVDSLMKISAPKIEVPKFKPPADGTIWFNTDDHALYIRCGDAWINAADGGVIKSMVPAFDIPMERMSPATAYHDGASGFNGLTWFGPVMPDVQRAV